MSFYSSDNYPFLNRFNNHFQEIKDELITVIDKPLTEIHKNTWAGERPNYLTSEHDKNTAWKTYTFKFFSIEHLPNLQSSPKTAEIIRSIPEIVTAEFSMLEPLTHILPHKGYTNKVLRAHLGLIIPEGDTGIKIENEKRIWEENKWLVFDDSKMHEAWNQTDQKRIVLMIDFIPPNSTITPKELADEIFHKTNDRHVLDIAPREQWLDWIKKGSFPIKL